MRWLPVILIFPYVIFLLKIYRGLPPGKNFNISTDPVTFVSVVIACCNEEKNLPVILDCLALQNYPENLFEVFIVNDNSTDRTFEIAETFNGISNVYVLNNNGRGKKQALRTGILAAKGRLIIATDADCTMGKNWIRTISAFYEMNQADLIICPVQLESSPGFFRRFQELEFIGLQGITAGSALSDNATMCNGANLSFTREAYLNHSGDLHDEINSGDDIFLLQSLKKDRRYRILWLESPDAMVTTDSQPAPGSFLNQRSRWISKGGSYSDSYTISLGIVTFIASLLQFSIMIGCIMYPVLIWTFLAVFILKSVPDFLILQNTSWRYDKRNLLWWFLPSQLVYPFYVLSVIVYSLIFREK